MHWYRFLPFILPAVGVFLLAGALRVSGFRSEVQADSLPGALPELKESTSSAEAAGVVERVLRRLSDPAKSWLQASVWLRSHVPGLMYQGEGMYLTAPGHRYRLEVRTRSESTRDCKPADGTLLSVSDGRDRWQASRVGTGGYHSVQRARLNAVAAEPDTRQLLCGPEQLLRTLHGHLLWVRRDVHAGEVVIFGVWYPHLREMFAPAKEPWPANLPRVCRLVLSGGELWPGRVEWWGPMEQGGPDRLLIEMEFRDPVWDRPLSEDECQRLFTFDPAGAEVEDLTPRSGRH
jgi:hypothetical protein